MGVADLTMTISSDMEAFPGSPQPQFIEWADADRDGYNMELVFMSSHTGTHMDAPLHFCKKGTSIDRIRAFRLVSRAVLIRAPSKPNTALTKREIVSFESKHGRLVPGQAAVFATGWSDQAARRGYFECNPGISASAAAHLAERKVGLVGIDSPSIDAGRAHSYPAHRVLCGAGIPIVENLTNLGSIPGQNFVLAVMPLKLRGATGAPARALAMWGKDSPVPKTGAKF